MPTYPFRCQKCGASFDLFLNLSERDAPQKCPRCGARRTKRQISAGVVGGGEHASRPACATPACSGSV
ncbi:MAG: zinc ribbon domain-containing protein [Candidatus Eisenbacteria bacterium]|nr:zinc ribbon domain-containing protein [Candidatus Eisenbacteria bacterium]